MKVLAVVAHPDDEVLGAGGALLRHRDMGDEIGLVFLGTGVGARPSDEEDRRRESVWGVAGDLRITACDWPGRDAPPDNAFDTVSLLDLVKCVERDIREFQPHTVYTHYAHDLNVDHRLTYRAVVTACRPGLTSVMRILSFEVPSSTECNAGPAFAPSVFIPINVAGKVELLKHYDQEMRPFPHPRSHEMVRHLAGWRGAQAGVPAAEAFVLVREVIVAH